MVTTPQLEAIKTIRLDRVLECAVVVSWDELMPDPASGLIHIEYETGPDDSLDYLKVWSSVIKGYWNLVCEYWIRPLWSHVTGLRLSRNCHSVDFAQILERVMRHENAFSKLPDRKGLIQIYPPTQEERIAAECWTREAFNHHGLVPAEIPTAA